MNIQKILLLLSVLVTLGGCATAEVDDGGNAVADTNPEGIICANEATLGSKMTHRVCTTRAEREEAARLTRERYRSRERGSPAIDGIKPASVGN
jgi:hypothetical protein